MNKLLAYFDLAATRRRIDGALAAESATNTAPVLPQYLALFAGVFFQPILAQFLAHRTVNYDNFWASIIPSLLVAVVLFPGAYRNSFDVDKPIFVQLCVIFTVGLGWQSIVGAAMGGAGGGPGGVGGGAGTGALPIPTATGGGL